MFQTTSQYIYIYNNYEYIYIYMVSIIYLSIDLSMYLSTYLSNLIQSNPIQSNLIYLSIYVYIYNNNLGVIGYHVISDVQKKPFLPSQAKGLSLVLKQFSCNRHSNVWCMSPYPLKNPKKHGLLADLY